MVGVAARAVLLAGAVTGPAGLVTGQTGPATSVEAGLTQLGRRRLAETVLGQCPASLAVLAVSGLATLVTAPGTGETLRPATVRSVAGWTVGNTAPGEIERRRPAPGAVRVPGPHTGLAGRVAGGAVGGVVEEEPGATSHHTLASSGHHGPGLTGPAPPGLAGQTVTGTVNTEPGQGPGGRGTPGDTLRGLPGQEQPGPAPGTLLAGRAGALGAGVVAGQTLRPGGGEGGGGAGGHTPPVMFQIATLQAVRRPGARAGSVTLRVAVRLLAGVSLPAALADRFLNII